MEGQGADLEKLTHKDTFLLWESAQNSLITVNSESLLETSVTSSTRHGQRGEGKVPCGFVGEVALHPLQSDSAVSEDMAQLRWQTAKLTSVVTAC